MVQGWKMRHEPVEVVCGGYLESCRVYKPLSITAEELSMLTGGWIRGQEVLLGLKAGTARLLW